VPRGPKPDFDFLDFDEADRVVNAADGEWRWMIPIACFERRRIRCHLAGGRPPARGPGTHGPRDRRDDDARNGSSSRGWSPKTNTGVQRVDPIDPRNAATTICRFERRSVFGWSITTMSRSRESWPASMRP